MHDSNAPLNRRQLLRGLAVAGAAPALVAFAAPAEAQQERAVTNGRIRQPVVFWCFNSAGERWDLARTCQVARQLGCQSVELIPPEDWRVLRENELTCAIAPNGAPMRPGNG